jgi:hypothetical protein
MQKAGRAWIQRCSTLDQLQKYRSIIGFDIDFAFRQQPHPFGVVGRLDEFDLGEVFGTSSAA